MASTKTSPSRRSGDTPPTAGARTNGVHLGLPLAGADGTVMVFDDPLTKVLGLDAQTSGTAAWIRYYIAALLLLFGLSVAAQTVTRLLAATNVAVGAPPQEIDVVVDEPPPPPPEAEAKPEQAPAPVKAPPHEATPTPPAPAPAQAAKVLTQEPDPNEPVDLTGDTIVTGNADSYAGGITASNGTGTRAVRGLASAKGAATEAAPAPPPPPGPDRSRKASIGAKEWNVPFPAEADTAQIDEAYVVLQMDIQADGTVSAVRVLTDPGNGFGREARRYALTLKIPPALDHDGNPITSTVTTKVHFTR